MKFAQYVNFAASYRKLIAQILMHTFQNISSCSSRKEQIISLIISKHFVIDFDVSGFSGLITLVRN